MNKFLFILLGLFIVGCNASESFIDPLKPKFETMSFDVVQKQLVIEQNLPDNVQKLLSSWFNEKVKINGFDGSMIFTISNFNQEVSSINEGKRVDVSLSFSVLITKDLQTKKKLINGSVSSFGTLTGNFSLSEFDTVIQNTQSDLILRLSRDLQSKI